MATVADSTAVHEFGSLSRAKFGPTYRNSAANSRGRREAPTDGVCRLQFQVGRFLVPRGFVRNWRASAELSYRKYDTNDDGADEN